MSNVENVAFAIYRRFIRGGYGSRREIKIDEDLVLKETLDDAVARRWKYLPTATRDSFFAEAEAAIEAMGGTPWLSR